MIAPRRPAKSLRQATIGTHLQAARTCYDHLAGELGVAVFDALVRRRLLTNDLEPTRKGTRTLAALGVDVEEAARLRRPFARRCLDWSERRDHLAGALGATIAARFFELGWIERMPTSRAVKVTAAGRRGLARELDVR